MKKYFSFTLALIAIVGGAIGGCLAQQSPISDLTHLQLQNIEALTRGEGGDQIPCHSESERDFNRSYVDCSTCTRSIGWKGIGTEAACTN